MLLVHDLLRESAARGCERLALISEARSVTFAQLDVESDAIARALQRGGLSRGDRVAVVASNAAESVTALFATLKAGGVFVPLSPLAKAHRLAEVLADCGAQALIAPSMAADGVGAAVARVPSLTQVLWTDPPATGAAPGKTFAEILGGSRETPADPGLIDQDLCAIIYTSGSTARPKGVMLTHRNLVNTTWAVATYLRNVPDDVVMCALPLSHTYGLCQVLVGARVGYTVVLERSFAYPYDVLRRMAEHRVTGLPGVPTLYAHLLKMEAALAEIDLSSIRYMTNAAGALSPAQIQRLTAAFPRAQLFSMYGLTECTRATYLDPSRLEDKVASVGKAIPNVEVYVVDGEGRRARPGVVGELVVRGSNVMRGYWGRPAETEEALREGEIPGEKVLYTGDLFRTDAEGFLYFVGRRDDLFKCKGEKVSPREIENVLYELPEVVEAAVVGVDGTIDGASIKAAVVLREGAGLSEQELRRHCRARLESFLVPKFIEVRASLPRTEGGKLDRRALAAESGALTGDRS